VKTFFSILSLFLCLACAAADGPKSVVSKEDKKAAEKEFKNAQDLQRAGKPDDALAAVLKAQELMPGNVEFMTLGEMLRQQIVSEHVEAGNHLAAAGDPLGAAQRFRTALSIDPQNAYVAQRLHDVAPPEGDAEHKHVLQLLA